MPGPRRARQRSAVPPRVDVQYQLKIGSRARAAAMEAKALRAAGATTAARKKEREALNLEEQAKFHTRAREAALEWKALTDAGNEKAALKQARKALRLEAKWRALGGTGDLFE